MEAFLQKVWRCLNFLRDFHGLRNSVATTFLASRVQEGKV